MPTFVPVSEEILNDRNGCNTQKNPLEINIMIDIETLNYYSNANLKHLFENFKHNVLDLDIGVHPVPDHLQIEM